MFLDAPKAGGVTQTGSYYFKRVWATRKPLWADRLASAWLIRRFIDPEATLLWLDKNQGRPSTAVGVGFEGATFSNNKDKVTVQEMLASFSPDQSETPAK